jgi:hypothetical protein
MNRRLFLQGIAGLATLAVASKGLPLPASARARIIEKARSGILCNECFELTEPVTLSGLENLTIVSCSFTMRGDAGGEPFLKISGCRNLHIDRCSFDGRDAINNPIMVYVDGADLPDAQAMISNCYFESAGTAFGFPVSPGSEVGNYYG